MADLDGLPPAINSRPVVSTLASQSGAKPERHRRTFNPSARTG